MQLIYLPLSVRVSLSLTHTYTCTTVHAHMHTHTLTQEKGALRLLDINNRVYDSSQWVKCEWIWATKNKKKNHTHTHTQVFKYLVFIETRHNICLEARPQEQLLDKQVLHHPLHMAKPRREGFRVVWEGLDEPCLKDAKLKTKLLQYRDCITGQKSWMMA